MIDPEAKKILQELHIDLAVMALRLRKLEVRLIELEPKTFKEGAILSLVPKGGE